MPQTTQNRQLLRLCLSLPQHAPNLWFNAIILCTVTSDWNLNVNVYYLIFHCRSFTVYLLDRYLPIVVAMIFMPFSPTSLAQTHLSNLICYYSFPFTLSFVHTEVPHCFIHFHSSRPLPVFTPHSWMPCLPSTAVNPNSFFKEDPAQTPPLVQKLLKCPCQWIPTRLGSHREIYYSTQVILPSAKFWIDMGLLPLFSHCCSSFSRLLCHLAWELTQLPFSLNSKSQDHWYPWDLGMDKSNQTMLTTGENGKALTFCSEQ